MLASPPSTNRRYHLLLGLVVLASLGVYAILTWRYPLLSLIGRPRANVGALSKQSLVTAGELILNGVALHGLYIVGALVCWWSARSRWTVALVWGGAISAALLLVAIYPVTSTDIFDYIFRGRIGAYYGGNPYIDLPNQFPKDPFLGNIGWPNAPSAYGPLWELLSYGLAFVGGNSLLRNVLLHKALAVATYLLCGLLIWRIARPAGPQAQLVGSFLWLWSPLALWEIVAAGHNDGLLVFCVLLGVWAAEHNRIRWAVVALTIGTLLKFLPILLLPLVVVYGMRNLATWRSRLWLGAHSVLLFAVLTVLAYWPFWEGAATLNTIAVREGFVTSAPLAVVSYALRQALALNWINDLLVLFGLPGPANAGDILAGVSRTGSGLLALGLVWQMWQVWRYGRGIWRATFGLLLWYLTLGSQWFQPWYVLWLLGLIAVRLERQTWAWIAAWALAGQASYLLQYFGQPLLFRRYGGGWSGQNLPIQALYCAIIFIPPLLVWAVGRLRQKDEGGKMKDEERKTELELSTALSSRSVGAQHLPG